MSDKLQSIANQVDEVTKWLTPQMKLVHSIVRVDKWMNEGYFIEFIDDRQNDIEIVEKVSSGLYRCLAFDDEKYPNVSDIAHLLSEVKWLYRDARRDGVYTVSYTAMMRDYTVQYQQLREVYLREVEMMLSL